MNPNQEKPTQKKPKKNSRRRPRKHPSSSNKTEGRNHKRKNNQRNSKWNRHRISDHFMKRDFDSREKDCTTCTGSLRISLGLVGIIEALRAKLNQRVDILTGYYCSDCREKKYGIKRDHHHSGVAADSRVNNMSITELFLVAETFPEIKGLGINFDDNHVHIDTRKEDERQTWVEKDEEWILLTEENRDQFIIPTHNDESNDTENTDS